MDLSRFSKPGKVDRIKIREESIANSRKLDPETTVQKALCGFLEISTIEAIKTKTITECINIYMNIRKLRHELWADYLFQTRTSTSYKFSDTRYGTFLKKTLCFHQTELDIDAIYPTDPKLVNLTPDILVYDPTNRTVHLGDITVTKGVDMARKRKVEKYLCIFNHLESINQIVSKQDMIIAEDLSNIHSVILQFQNVGLIEVENIKLKKVILFHKAANAAMERLATENDDPRQFERSRIAQDLDKEQEANNAANKELFKLLDVKITDDICREEALFDEDHYIRMLKEETDREFDTYFDDGFDSAKKEFEKLFDKFKKAEVHSHAKSTLKAVYNTQDVEEKAGHDLLLDYVRDIEYSSNDNNAQMILNFLPTTGQIHMMKNYKLGTTTRAQDSANKVYGEWQYTRIKNHENNLTEVMNHVLGQGKKRPNERKPPSTIHPDNYPDAVNFIERAIMQLGEVSDKPSFLTDEWDAKTTAEFENTKHERKVYNYVKSTNGAQLGQSLSMLYQRLVHVKTHLSVKDNVFIPPNGAFICIIPKEHAPVNTQNCQMPMLFVTRKKKNSKMEFCDGTQIFETNEYIYQIGELCRINMDKISHWDQAGYRIVASASHLLSTSETLYRASKRVVGIVTMMTLDLHQKTSEYVDLMKYISFMPFSDVSRVSKLIESKFDKFLKTNLDVWMIHEIRDFMYRLADGSVTGDKPKLKVYNGAVLHESLGMDITIPSFMNKDDKHKKMSDFIEEISVINILRGKKFYGDQFMDRSLAATAEWNNEFNEEEIKYEGWTEGRGTGVYADIFPFDSKFCFSKDVIIHAMDYCDKYYPIDSNKVMGKLDKLNYNGYIHDVCSLRGCTKPIYERKHSKDLHTTSLDACLDYYKSVNYDELLCTSVCFAKGFANPDFKAEYTMSPKEQRGPGRAIATPTLLTKIINMMIEKPEQAIGTFRANNILVAGKNKLLEQSKTYISLLEIGDAHRKKQVYQCTEDQSKFSENDNTRKFYTYIRNNKLLPDTVRQMQLDCIKKQIGREHLTKHMPRRILERPELYKYVNDAQNGISVHIGWPQGMLNNISTSIHSLADYWITHAFNIAYKSSIITKGLVHSDDSWYGIACDKLEEFKRFALFRSKAKQLFCLKLNDKKLWGSRYLGELVSNFNINGEVLVPLCKIIANGFNNLLYQNWVIDVHNQVSTIQQLYRQGANLGTITMVATILRQQIISAYNLTNNLPDNFYLLPVEMGGYPHTSPFELGVTGLNSHYKEIYNFIRNNPASEVADMVLKTMRLSMIYNKSKNQDDVVSYLEKHGGLQELEIDRETAEEDDQFSNIVIPKRGDVFSCIRHLMPKSKKISMTMEKIRLLPFESDGMEMIITKPKSIVVALGHLKAQRDTLLFSLASEKYTNNKRRLAVNQSIQATGKTVRLSGHKPQTLRSLIQMIKKMDIMPMPSELLAASFTDDSGLVDLLNSIVNYSTLTMTSTTKRKIVNKLPEFENKFNTVVRMQNVLMYIVDEVRNTNYRAVYGGRADPLEMVMDDAKMVKRQFSSYFEYYEVERACGLIMQLYLDQQHTRLWIQPSLRTEDMTSFMCDLYGKTLNRENNFDVSIDYTSTAELTTDTKIVQTLYTIEVLNRLYDNKFRISSFQDKKVGKVLRDINYSELPQDDYIKFAVLQHLYNNNDYHLRAHDSKKIYSQEYEGAQKMHKGDYTGRFAVWLKYGQMVCYIEGVPGDLRIRVNKTSLINELLKAMFIYVNRDHPKYKYNSAHNWHMSSFWGSVTRQEELKLIAYSGCCTMITKTYSTKGVSVRSVPELSYPTRDIIDLKPKFELDPSLRIVYKIKEDSKIRLDNIKQNMYAPLVNYVELHADTIDGFSNQQLLSSKMILNITMRRQFNVSLNVVKDLIKSRFEGYDMLPLGYLMANVYRRFQPNMEQSLLPHFAKEPEYITETLEGIEVGKVISMAERTAPEDLTSVNIEYIDMESETTGALVKYKSLLKLFCRYVCTTVSGRDKIGFIYSIIKHPSFATIVTKLDETIDKEYTMKEFISYFRFCEPNLDVYTYILANDLDDQTTHDKIDYSFVLNQPTLTYTHPLNAARANYCIDETLALLEVEPPVNPLLSRVY